MSVRVRDLAYLDPALVAQTLSQLDYGLFEQWQETLQRTSGKDASVRVSLWGAANLGGGGQRSATEGSAVVFAQTAESYASRLLFRLEEEHQLMRLESEAEEDLRRGTVIVAEGKFDPLTDMLDPFATEGWTGTPMLAFYEVKKHPNRVLIQVGAFVVAAPLADANLRVSVEELDGDIVELVAIVRRAFPNTSDETRKLVIGRPIALY